MVDRKNFSYKSNQLVFLGILHARALVRECLMETDRSARS